MSADLDADLSLEILDLRVQRADHRHEAEHEPLAGCEFELADTTARGAAELGHQRCRMLPTRVPLSPEERLHPGDSQTASVRRTGIALKEREQDLRVHVAKQPQRAGPEPLELRAELVNDPGARLDEILPGAGQRPDRLRAIAVRLEHPEAMMIGARELAEHERVEAIAPSPAGRAIVSSPSQ